MLGILCTQLRPIAWMVMGSTSSFAQRASWLPLSEDLIKGMYLSREFVKSLLDQEKVKSFSFSTVPRYLTNS